MNVLDMNTQGGAAHGEITLFPLDAPEVQGLGEPLYPEIPKDKCTQVQPNPDGTITAAHSESGHNHVIRGQALGTVHCFQMDDNPALMFFEIEGDATMEHLKPGSYSHGMFGIKPGRYVGKISREGVQGSPGAWQNARD